MRYLSALLGAGSIALRIYLGFTILLALLAAVAANGWLQAKHVAEMRRAEELAVRVDDRKADSPLEVHLLERQADRVAEPVLDHAGHHVEEVDEVDDARGIAVRKADQALARERLQHLYRL